MKVFRMTEDAKLPTKNDGDRAYDLYSIEDGYVGFGEIAKFRTGIKIDFPDGYHGILKSRSGLAIKEGIHVLGGVIDNSYTGEIIVILTCSKMISNPYTGLNYTDMIGHSPYRIQKGEKICQIKLEKDVTLEINEVFNEEELKVTQRQDKGFGSSGKF